MPHIRSSDRVRQGKVIVLLALSLTAVIGAVAIALDGGFLLEHRRQVQGAADVAAMAAAVDLYTNYRLEQGLDPQGTAVARAREAAASQGYADGPGTTVTVNIPPKSGDAVGRAGYVEVIVEYLQPRYFSSIFGSQALPVQGRAVARGRWTSMKTGILVLDLSTSEALKANGSGSVSVTNCDIIVNSSAPSSVGSDGQGAVIQVTNGSFELTGGVKANTTLLGPVNSNQIPTPDPLAYIPEPKLPATALQANSSRPTSANVTPYLKALNLNPKDVNGQVYVLEPGRYDKLPNFSNGDVVILKQASANGAGGVYYLNGSGFTSTGATVVMDPIGSTGGLMLFNNPGSSNQGISLTGGLVNLAPPTSGPYQGISLFQARSADVDIQITGQGGTAISGTFYSANGNIKITGSSATTLDVIGSQYISRTLQSGGNGKYAVNWDPDKTARIRQLGLVE